MFLHTSTFKKMLKDSWKFGGIIVGRLDDRSLFVLGSYWATWFDYTSMPNRIKAAIMEYAGELPELGVIFKARFNEPNQYELEDKPLFDVHKNWQLATTPLVVTPVSIDRFQLLQDASNDYRGVDSFFNSLIDNKEMEECEGSVMGPCTTDYPGFVYWATELCILGILPARFAKDEEKEILKALSAVDFYERKV